MYGLRPYGTLAYGEPADPADAVTLLVAEAFLEATGTYSVYVATEEFITEAGDEPSRTPFDGTLGQPLRMTRSINGDGFSGFIQTHGEMIIANADGAYDWLPEYYALDGRDQEIRLGVPGEPYKNWLTIFKGTAASLHITEDEFQIDLQDYGYKLDVPLQENTYAGTGGMEGGADLAGKRKPITLGYAGNVTPVLVQANMQLYQIHDGQVQAIPAVYANAVALTPGADHATPAALLAATITSGHYHTCLAAGLFRVNFLLDGNVITADVQGDASGEGFVSTVADIVRRVAAPHLDSADGEPLYELLAWDNDTEADVPFAWDDNDGVEQLLTWEDPVYQTSGLYEPAFARHATEYPYEMGYYFAQDDSSTVADALTRIVGFGAFIGFRRDGKLSIGSIATPNGPPVLRLDRIDIVDIRRERLPSGMSPPAWRWKIGYARNWRVQDSEVAGSVSDARRAFLAEETRFAVAESATIRNDHPFAGEREVGGYYRDAVDARAFGERLLALFSRSSSLYRLTIDERGFALEIGDVIHVTYPRFDLRTGRSLLVVEINEDAAAQRVEIVGWG